MPGYRARASAERPAYSAGRACGGRLGAVLPAGNRPAAAGLLQHSPRMLAQRRQVAGLFGSTPGDAAGRVPAGVVAQRMLVAAPSAAAGADNQVNLNMNRLRDADPLEYRLGAIRTLLDGEVLHVAGHGEGGDGHKSAAFDAFTEPKEFVQWLIDEDLPERVGGIQLHGCETAGFAAACEQLLHAYRIKAEPGASRVPIRGVPNAYFASLAGQVGSIDTRVHGPDSKVRTTAQIGMTDDGFRRRLGERLLEEVIPLKSPLALRPALIDAFVAGVKRELKATQPGPFAMVGLGRVVEQVAKLKGATQDPIELAALEEAEDYLAMFKIRCERVTESVLYPSRPRRERTSRPAPPSGPRSAPPPVNHPAVEFDPEDPFASPRKSVAATTPAPEESVLPSSDDW